WCECCAGWARSLHSYAPCSRRQKAPRRDSCYHPATLAPRGAPMDRESSQLIRGLEGVGAAPTQLCDLDGTHGRLAYRGYDITDLARHASFEEVAHLLWHGDLPTAGELDRTTRSEEHTSELQSR